MVGELTIDQARTLAEARGLDLVEVSPNSQPPVCKLVNWGKMKYEETRAERRARAHQKTIQVKEIRLGLKISEHDRKLKIDKAKQFLVKGHKVHIVIKMRGREQTFPERAYSQLASMVEEIGGKVEQPPGRIGNQISTTLGSS